MADTRYTVAGANIDSRPKRPTPWQRLGASAALLLEWFRLDLRHGWLGSHRRRNNEQAVPLNRAERRLKSTLIKRKRLGLDLPYGSVAIKDGLMVGATGPPTTLAPTKRQTKVKVDEGEIPF